MNRWSGLVSKKALVSLQQDGIPLIVAFLSGHYYDGKRCTQQNPLV